MSDVLITVRDRIGLITLNRPESLNSWTTQMQGEIAETIQAFADDDAVDAVVLTGTGDRAFCAGQDLNETAQFTPDQVEGWLENFKSVYDAILSTPKPVVAALNGLAVGSGYQFALVCDYRIAHPGIRIGQPEVNSGIPSITGHFLTHYCLGHSRTVDLMLSGRLLDADEAHRVGLIHRLVPREAVLEEAISQARSLAERPKLAFRLTKQRIRDVLWPGLLEAFDAGLEIDRVAWESGEPQQTARDFFAARGASRLKAASR
jgi:enoyl-CoA hydratase/carnithine racemase